jgi:3'-phosphoadenosine 5'-phosphosulfate sulfotransferase (PAPS reductase)/FAD synthetase
MTNSQRKGSTGEREAAGANCWLSYGGGVNSTALCIALHNKLVPGVSSWRVVFSDTYDESDETYNYIDTVMRPWLRARGKVLETVCDKEGVLERWERLSVTGNRVLRTCTVEAKIKVINAHIAAHGNKDDVQLIGIDADEAHRAKEPRDGRKVSFPLLALDWGRDECIEAIKGAGLPVPPKSGCWHCPFMRRKQIINLSVSAPCKFDRIVRLEDAANAKHGPAPGGSPRMQWHRPAREIRDGGALFADASKDLPCGCWDGETAEDAI